MKYFFYFFRCIFVDVSHISVLLLNSHINRILCDASLTRVLNTILITYRESLFFFFYKHHV